MSNSNQPYEKNVRLQPALTKGWGNLPPPFSTLQTLTLQPYDEFVMLTGTWRKGGYKLYPPFAAPEAVEAT